MNIAFVSHDAKKELLAQFCIAYSKIFEKHSLYATETTGKIIAEATGLNVNRLLSGSQGGVQQIASRVACNEIDLLIFFRDPFDENIQNPTDFNLIRVCDMHNVPVATNIATAEVLVHGLKRGDLNWRKYTK